MQITKCVRFQLQGIEIFIIRNIVTHNISSKIEYKGLSLEQAVNLIINKKLKKQNVLGGIVGIDK